MNSFSTEKKKNRLLKRRCINIRKIKKTLITIPSSTFASLLYGAGTSSAVLNCLNVKLRCNEKSIFRVYINRTICLQL